MRRRRNEAEDARSGRGAACKKAGKALYMLLPILLTLAGCVRGGAGGPEEASASFFGMDTYITLTAYGEGARSALADAQERMAQLEQSLSATDAGSDVYVLNHGGGKPVAVGEDTESLVSFVLEMAERTDGALDPTIYPVLLAWGFTAEENRVPGEEELARLLSKVDYRKVAVGDGVITLPEGMALDLGAVGKGYAGDVLAGLLREAGVQSALLDLGGNVQVLGGKPDGSDWRVGIRNPAGEGILGVLAVRDVAVVTSGSYERFFLGEDGSRYGHIIDPGTGYPVENGLLSVTVVAAEGKYCDALSTALFVMGREGAVEYWRTHRDFEMILAAEGGEILVTEGLAARFARGEQGGGWKVGVVE